MRGWSKLNIDNFLEGLFDSISCSERNRPSLNEDYFETYHCILTKLADRFAPISKITLRRQRLAVWMDDECRQLRRRSRMKERQFRRSGLIEDRREWVLQERARHQIYRRKEQQYWSMRTAGQAKQPRKLWRTLNTLLGANQSHQPPKNSPSAQQFADFFEAKVAAVRRSTGGGEVLSELPPAS